MCNRQSQFYAILATELLTAATSGPDGPLTVAANGPPELLSSYFRKKLDIVSFYFLLGEC